MISVAIDGPSGAGKSSLAKRLAKELGYLYVDTGAMYRSIGLYAKRAGADTKDAAAVEALLPSIRLELKYVDGAQRVLLCGEDVSEAIRAEEIGMAASDVSAHPAVRRFLLDTQRNMALTHDLVATKRQLQNGVKNMPFFVAKNLALRCAKKSDCTCRLCAEKIFRLFVWVFFGAKDCVTQNLP